MAKKKLWRILPVVLFAVLLTVIFVLNHTPEDTFVIPDHIIICLDAGHGGDDPGAVNGDRQEKDDNLNMALAVRDALDAAGHDNLEVILTREDDTPLTLEERVEFANRNKATLFVSLHRNSGGGQGVETWISAAGLKPETALATYIQKNLVEVGVAKDRGVKKGTAGNPKTSYYVVGNTLMPACLVELGFIDDNAADNTLLDEHFTDYAQAIADGILKMVKLK
ncbi:MAG: N-acetylmuramoyl-L-alanine amidase [Clostridia bacterium]|nr:N-acetylmuramoyl-L-alanine amidase [Clostridia bacterium]MBP3588136.1 N-acetylmuramoyl-L-alanine amidase [Clostridia bacterium]